MDIRDRMNVNLPALTNTDTKSAPKAKKEEAQALPQDKVSIGQHEEIPRSKAIRNVFGAIGTAVGAVLGRIAVGVAGGIAGAVAGSTAGPLGTVIGTIAGLGVGSLYEYRSKMGRFGGGMLGGAVGIAASKAATLIPGYTPSKALTEETKGFSYKSLFKKLLSPNYTSHKKISSEEAQEVIKNLKPGDLIITNNDEDYKFELAQKLMGKTGAWTHIGMVSDKNTVLEVLISTDGPTESDPESLFTSNHHVAILRPDYKNPDSVKGSIKKAREYFGKAEYDFDFRLGTEDKLYCQEYIYKALQDGAPEVNVKPSRFMGLDYLSADDFLESPDVKQTWSTGSNFWMNLLSKFD